MVASRNYNSLSGKGVQKCTPRPEAVLSQPRCSCRELWRPVQLGRHLVGTSKKTKSEPLSVVSRTMDNLIKKKSNSFEL